MKRETLAVGAYHHILNRGARGMDIVRDQGDRWNFVSNLYHLNDEFYKPNWRRDLGSNVLDRPLEWPDQKPLVKIMGFCLMDNHFHLLINEIQEGGLSVFMKRLQNSMSLQFNKKHGGKGSIFQGPYQERPIYTDEDLRNVAFYIVVKNVFERYPGGGIKKALIEFEKAWDWAVADPFSSFADHVGFRKSPVVNLDVLDELSQMSVNKKKKEVFEYLENWQERKALIDDIILE